MKSNDLFKIVAWIAKREQEGMRAMVLLYAIWSEMIRNSVHLPFKKGQILVVMGQNLKELEMTKIN